MTISVAALAQRGLNIAVLVKQVPEVEEMRLVDSRIVREGVPLEINAYCRRAVACGVLLARETGGTCTTVTLGPPAAEDALREAVAWGADRGVLITDPAFAGSDTLATAKALTAFLRDRGFDLILLGRNSVDADTGQVGPQIAEFLELPFVASVKTLTIDETLTARARVELDDGLADAEVPLPAVISCAERLCAPAKVPPEGRSAVPPDRIEVISAAELGPGPWGQEASPTRVGEVRLVEQRRRGFRADGPLDQQVTAALDVLAELAAFDHSAVDVGSLPPVARGADLASARGRIAVVLDPDQRRAGEELAGAAAELAAARGARVVAVDFTGGPAASLGPWGADEVVQVPGVQAASDAASMLAGWCERTRPWAMLGTGTLWGREVFGRVAAHLDLGLVGDAVELSADGDRLVAWKPAFGDRLVAAITSTSPVQLVTVRPGVLPPRSPRAAATLDTHVETWTAAPQVRLSSITHDDDLVSLAEAPIVICVGAGVAPDGYSLLEDWRIRLGAELGATRKVTDNGWMPRSRQIGLTGRHVSPRLYLAIGVRGKLNHTVGFGTARAVLAVNTDPAAPIFGHADAGIVGDWRATADLLFPALEERLLGVVDRAAG